jgi:hypothetical protein
MGLNTTVSNDILDALLSNDTFQGPATVYLSLHDDDPGATGADEITGGSYAREAVAFGAASSGAVANTGVIEFEDMPAVTVTHVGYWSASTAGTFQFSGAVAAPSAISAGNTLRFAIGALTVDLA